MPGAVVVDVPAGQTHASAPGPGSGGQVEDGLELGGPAVQGEPGDGRGAGLPATLPVAAAGARELLGRLGERLDVAHGHEPDRGRGPRDLADAAGVEGGDRGAGRQRLRDDEAERLLPERGDERAGAAADEPGEVRLPERPEVFGAVAEERADVLLEVRDVADAAGDAQRPAGEPRGLHGEVQALLRHDPPEPDEVVAAGSEPPAAGVDRVRHHERVDAVLPATRRPCRR